MARTCHNLNMNETSKNKDGVSELKVDLGSTFKIESTARKILRLIPRKEISGKLGVTDQVISQWANNISPMPFVRQIETIKAAKNYIGEWQELEDEIDLHLVNAFGRKYE